MSTSKAMKDTVYIDVDDEITGIIDKVENAKHKIVALVLPKRSASLQSIVNMRLLKRSAEKAGKHVVLITNDSALLPLAGAASMYVAKNLQSKPEIPPAPNSFLQEPADESSIDERLDETAKIDYNKPIGELAAASELDDSPIDLDDEDTKAATTAPEAAGGPKNKKLKVPNFEKFRLLLIAGVAAVIGLVVFAIFAIFILPKAEVTIKTASEPVSANFKLTTSDTATALDEEKAIIPASIKKADQNSTQQVPATGQKNNGEKSRGQVTLRNCVDDEVVVPAGSAVSSGGLTYITQKSASLDDDVIQGGACASSGSHTAKVDVVAQSPGAKYNATQSSSYSYAVSCPQCSKVDARSEGLTGGTDDMITVVSQQDVETAKQKVSSDDTDEFSRTFQEQLEDTGFYVLTSTLKLSDPTTTTTPEVGQPASSVTVSLKITYTVLVVPEADLEKAVSNKLKEQIDEKRQKLSLDNVLEDLDITIENQSSPSKATLAISQETTAVPVIDINTLKTQIGGKKRSEIEGIAKQYPGVESVSVKYSPFWVSKAPSKPDKITIKLEEIQNDGGGN